MRDESIESLLARVIHSEDLIVHFQPIVHLHNRQIYGYEGLIRGPVNTVLHSPGRLFAVAARENRLAELDILCRRKVIHRFTELNLPGRLFINVDPITMQHEQFQEGKTLEFIEQVGVDPGRIIIELTETHPVEDIQLMQQAMHHYRQMGFRVAIDDLGAGYSGLKLWSAIRPDIVKVDRHFIQGVDEDRTKQQFVNAILKTATALGSRVITEGVETEKEYATLRKLGIEMVQGYYFCRPVSVPPLEIQETVFRREPRNDERLELPTVAQILRPAFSLQSETRVHQVGELFSTMPELESIVILQDTEVLGMVLRREFMNMYASLYGKELYGKQPIVRFINRNILQVEKSLPLEEVSYRLTSALNLHTDEFIILDKCTLAGKARMIDLLHAITKLQINRARHANPLTLLPGNVPIQEELQKLFRRNRSFVICYFDLDNFKPFNDFFGFSRGDKVIRFCSELLLANIDEQQNFIGHVGGDDFVAIFCSSDWQEVVRRILRQFDESISGLYNGHIGCSIKSTDRNGKPQRYSRMTLSVGAVLVQASDTRCHLDLSEEAAVAKGRAKKIEGSSLYIHELNRGQLGAEPAENVAA
ncbi:bifunctional diguanylate cyclase/phosphodiesterase [Desulfogranum mediterraneum]|uniref:bifunctional diguanylate cyclase/phosphodiesterase n=1 Tax=Desulfogranum mediterraneum TaxID=160661 RepID=UPI00042549E7|nr:bifunctional diguanylate cyclase/phosphodiesterase [Desulfogranum mediterraneum]